MRGRSGRLARTLATLSRYRNPLHVIRKRLFGSPDDPMTLVDRETGVQCQCPLAAFHIFASIWYGHDYLITARPWALSDYSGEAQLLRTDLLGGAMSTIVPEFARRAGVPVLDQVPVRAERLSEIIELFDLSSVRLCKIDAEGSEIAILRGLERIHCRRLDSLVMEYHPEVYQLSELLAIPLQWGTHQISLMDEKPFSGNIVRAVATSSLLGSS